MLRNKRGMVWNRGRLRNRTGGSGEHREVEEQEGDGVELGEAGE